MVIAAADVLAEQGFNYQRCMHVVAQDSSDGGAHDLCAVDPAAHSRSSHLGQYPGDGVSGQGTPRRTFWAAGAVA